MTLAICPCPSRRITTWLARALAGCESCLEFGCGVGTYMGNAVPCARQHGIELFDTYVQEARSKGHAVHQGDMRSFEEIPGEFDAAVFIDSLEHLTREDALDLIARCKERFKRIVVFAPEGVHVNPPTDDNVLNLHLSTWMAQDMRDLGFTVERHPNFHSWCKGAFFAEWTKE